MLSKLHTLATYTQRESALNTLWIGSWLAWCASHMLGTWW